MHFVLLFQFFSPTINHPLLAIFNPML
ncbi:hypothetical protein A2U01_0062099, partial [Trifolium medium]|nr:hypothetical protein [Trifolium medium]